jgi:WD40 repeat protein/energy-coupling factor transporter ATP-binding protein EcfA2
VSWPLPENPFVGLRPFETEETLLFFGRHEQTRELLRQLHKTRFLAVVGSSGCGKSSLIRAGLIPKLLGGFLVEDRDAWLVAKMKPGEAPLLHLAEAILVATGQIADRAADSPLAAAIPDRGLAGLLEHLAPHLENSNANLLLLVDQFEEIFRFSAFSRAPQQREEAAQFVAIMLGLAEQRQFPIYVAMTMRSDYLGDCDAFLGLPEAMNHSQFLVPRLTRQQRREAIKGPVRLYQGGISDRLTDRLLNETGETRDDLPILQHALMRTWDHAHKNAGAAGDGTLDLEHYEAIGTVKGALSQHAEEALEGTDERARSLAKQLFQALTEVDPGNRRIRRPAKLSEIEAITGAGRDEIWRIILRFRSEGRSFLVLSSENPDKDPLIDISHESLIRQWERLNRWVDEEVESADIYRRLSETARLHQQGKAGYYRDPDLQIAVKWNEKRKPNEAWAERYGPDFAGAMEFLRESLAESEREVEERETARKRTVRNLAILLLLAAAASIIAVYLGIKANQLATENYTIAAKNATIAAKNAAIAAENAAIAAENAAIAAENAAIAAEKERVAQRARTEKVEAAYQRSIAETNKERAVSAEDEAVHLKTRAISREMASQAINSLDSQPDLSLLLSLEANRLDETDVNALSSLLTGLQTLTKPAEQTSGSQFSLDGILVGHNDYIWSLAFDPVDQNILASGSADGSIIVWDLATGKMIHRIKAHDGEVLSIAFSPDGRFLASGGTDSSVKLWNTANEQSVFEGKHRNWVLGVAFSPDGKYLASGSSDDKVVLWQIEGERVKYLKTLAEHNDNVNALAFSPDSKTLASGSRDGTVILWDVEGGSAKARLQDLLDTSILDIAFSPNGKYLAGSGGDNAPWIALWGTENYQLITLLKGHSSRVFSVAFNHDSTLLASSSSDTSIRLWNVPSGEPFGETLKGGIDWVLSVDFSPSAENILASGGTQGRILLWKQPPKAVLQKPKKELIRNLEGPSANFGCGILSENGEKLGQVGSVGFSPDGGQLAAGLADGGIMFWDVTTGQMLATILEHSGCVRSVAYSPSGGILASGTQEGSIVLLDTQTREVLRTLEHGAPVNSVAFPTNGELLASAGEDQTILLWDLNTGEPRNITPIFDQEKPATSLSLAFSPDSRFLASGMSDNKILLFDIPSGNIVQELLGHSEPVKSVAFSGDGKKLASGSADGTIVIWDIAAGEIQHKLSAHTGDVTSLALGLEYDWEWLISGSTDNTLILWDAATGKQIGKPFDLHTSDVLSAAFGPNGEFIASIGADNQVILWDVEVEYWRSLACELALRNLTSEEWGQYLPPDEYRATCPQYEIESPTATPTPSQ